MYLFPFSFILLVSSFSMCVSYRQFTAGFCFLIQSDNLPSNWNVWSITYYYRLVRFIILLFAFYLSPVLCPLFIFFFQSSFRLSALGIPPLLLWRLTNYNCVSTHTVLVGSLSRHANTYSNSGLPASGPVSPTTVTDGHTHAHRHLPGPPMSCPQSCARLSDLILFNLSVTFYPLI